MSQFSLDEEFGTPSKIPTNEADTDLSMFDKPNATGSRDNLRMKSLYRKFDPLIESPKNSTAEGTEADTTAASLETLSVIDRAQKLLQHKSSDKNASTRRAAVSNEMLTRAQWEEEKDAAVREAVAQAEEEALIVQMETEELRGQLQVEREQNQQLTAVMEEYSTEITRLMESNTADKEGESSKLQLLRSEKEQVENDLEKTETAFADLHEKYMKLKEVLENYKENQVVLQDAVSKGQLGINLAEDRYNKLRTHAEEKIREANNEIATVREQLQSTTVALTMKVKTAEQESASLKREIALKVQDNAELTAICDELVKKLEGT
eukprot:m.45734 g.45734  ORF g.45734 m.45734 type:complete len:322 (-) comp20044_c0_seq1:251-1216(-)